MYFRVVLSQGLSCPCWVLKFPGFAFNFIEHCHLVDVKENASKRRQLKDGGTLENKMIGPLSKLPFLDEGFPL